MRYFRFFTVFALLVGLFTLFQALRLYQSPTIIIEWSTASELDVAGFNILRGETSDGPFKQINDSLIPPAEDALTGGNYMFEDGDVEGGKTYYYQLQEVELSGAVVIHEPTEEAQAVRGGVIEAILGVVLILGALLMLIKNRQ